MRARTGCLGIVFVSAVLCAGILQLRPRSVPGVRPAPLPETRSPGSRTMAPPVPVSAAPADPEPVEALREPTDDAPLPEACQKLEYDSPLDAAEDLSVREGFALVGVAALTTLDASTGLGAVESLRHDPELGLALAEGASSIDATLGMVTFMALASGFEEPPEPEDALRSRMARWYARGPDELGGQFALLGAMAPRKGDPESRARALASVAPRILHPAVQRLALLRTRRADEPYRAALAAMPLRDPRFVACRDARLARPLGAVEATE